MRLDNGMRFDHCIGLQDWDALDGRIFDGDTLKCHDGSLNAGESIKVGDRAYRYEGDDSLGHSIFTPLEPFPVFEMIEKPYKDLFIVLEIYPMENGHHCVRPYVQSGESSGAYSRRGFQFAGEFDTREAGIEAGLQAGQKEIDDFYS